jgi:hypothetical protein
VPEERVRSSGEPRTRAAWPWPLPERRVAGAKIDAVKRRICSPGGESRRASRRCLAPSLRILPASRPPTLKLFLSPHCFAVAWIFDFHPAHALAVWRGLLLGDNTFEVALTGCAEQSQPSLLDEVCIEHRR